MIGIPILVPCKEPKEGMKIVYGDNKRNPYTIDEIYKVDVEFNNFKGLVSLKKMFLLPFNLFELQQIAIEYKEDGFTSHMSPKKIKHTIPIPPDDYERVLPLLGQQVEFKVSCLWNQEKPGLVHICCKHCPPRVAKLITSPSIVYTEIEVEALVLNAYLRGTSKDEILNWWKLVKKK